MTVTKVKKLSYDELINSTTMFYMNHACEESIKDMIESQTADIINGFGTIVSKETLKSYIIKNKDSLSLLTSVAEISEERFKRIVSMIRKERGFVFSTEWGLNKVRSAMLESPSMMEIILDLLWDGKNNSKFRSCVPMFYLENMSIKECISTKIQDNRSVRQLVKRGLEGTYSNMIGDAILDEIEKKIKKVCSELDLEYQKNGRVPILDRAVSFVIGSAAKPKFILDVSYNVTTSSSQGSKKEAARKTEVIVKNERLQGNDVIYVNFLDGAGWIARQSDLREIYRCSDYVVNIQNIGLLEDIIDANIKLM